VKESAIQAIVRCLPHFPLSQFTENFCLSQTQDAPKEAAQAEIEAAESTKFDDGAPGQTSEAETDHEQKEKPHAEPKKGTLQDDQDSEPRPTDLGEAREQTMKVRLLHLILVGFRRPTGSSAFTSVVV
jgi:hypothetical protein